MRFQVAKCRAGRIGPAAPVLAKPVLAKPVFLKVKIKFPFLQKASNKQE